MRLNYHYDVYGDADSPHTFDMKPVADIWVTLSNA